MFGFSKWPLLILTILGGVGIVLLVVQWRQLRHRILAGCTVIFLLAAATRAYWGYLHIDQLRQRAAFDYGFEGGVWLLAGTAFVLGGTWFFRERRLHALFLTMVSGYLFCIFSVLLSTM
ncbi:MAG TPA: hypothetical protein VH139_01415 [Acidobacteriaceae bacterium]|jgi:hypothetical protein|nr:hypothetical protein [Acidobacteriaceae bacterium]